VGGPYVDPGVIGGIQLTIIAALLGNVFGVVGGLLGGRALHREIPFGPALVAGWLVSVVLSERLLG
jgi:prepilin signal peptidase PulO-like enzyme (type II secretory pathway)